MRDALAVGLELTGLATALVPDEFGGCLLNLGVDLLRGALAVSGPSKSSGSSRSSGTNPFQEHIDQVNKLVQGGEFAKAERYVDQLWWPAELKADVTRQIADFRDRYRAEMARLVQMNARLNELVRAGDSYGAREYVESLDLPYDQKRAILDKIPAAIQQIHESARIRQVLQACEVQVNAYLARGDGDQAISYVQSLNLPKEIKKQIVADIRRIAKEAADRQRWAQELDTLLQTGRFHKARKYVERLPVANTVKTRLLSQIPDVPPESFSGEERIAQALSGNLGTVLLVATMGAAVLWVVFK